MSDADFAWTENRRCDNTDQREEASSSSSTQFRPAMAVLRPKSLVSKSTSQHLHLPGLPKQRCRIASEVRDDTYIPRGCTIRRRNHTLTVRIYGAAAIVVVIGHFYGEPDDHGNAEETQEQKGGQSDEQIFLLSFDFHNLQIHETRVAFLALRPKSCAVHGLYASSVKVTVLLYCLVAEPEEEQNRSGAITSSWTKRALNRIVLNGRT